MAGVLLHLGLVVALLAVAFTGAVGPAQAGGGDYCVYMDEHQSPPLRVEPEDCTVPFGIAFGLPV